MIYVAGPSGTQVHRYRFDGAYLGGLGRAGSGPGELLGIGGLSARGDTVWVRDSRARRFTAFVEGRYVRSVSAPMLAPRGPGAGFAAVDILPGDRVLLVEGLGATAPSWLRDGGARVLTVGTSSSPADTVAVLEVGPGPIVASGPGGSRLVLQQPWVQRDQFGVAPSGTFYALARVAAGRANQPLAVEVVVNSLESEGPAVGPQRRRSFVEPAPLSPSDVDEWLAEAVPDHMPGRDLLRDEVKKQLYRPSRRPAIGRVLVAADSTIWVEVRPETGTAWLLFRSHQVARRCHIGEPVRLWWVGARTIWGVVVDPDATPVIVRLRFGS